MAANGDSISAWPAGSVIVALINVLLLAIVMVLIGRGIEATRLADNLDRRQL